MNYEGNSVSTFPSTFINKNPVKKIDENNLISESSINLSYLLISTYNESQKYSLDSQLYVIDILDLDINCLVNDLNYFCKNFIPKLASQIDFGNSILRQYQTELLEKKSSFSSCRSSNSLCFLKNYLSFLQNNSESISSSISNISTFDKSYFNSEDQPYNASILTRIGSIISIQNQIILILSHKISTLQYNIISICENYIKMHKYEPEYIEKIKIILKQLTERKKIKDGKILTLIKSNDNYYVNEMKRRYNTHCTDKYRYTAPYTPKGAQNQVFRFQFGNSNQVVAVPKAIDSRSISKSITGNQILTKKVDSPPTPILENRNNNKNASPHSSSFIQSKSSLTTKSILEM